MNGSSKKHKKKRKQKKVAAGVREAVIFIAL